MNIASNIVKLFLLICNIGAIIIERQTTMKSHLTTLRHQTMQRQQATLRQQTTQNDAALVQRILREPFLINVRRIIESPEIITSLPIIIELCLTIYEFVRESGSFHFAMKYISVVWKGIQLFFSWRNQENQPNEEFVV